MNEKMTFRTIVIEDDDRIRNLIKLTASSLKHEVLEFEDPVFCPIYKRRRCECEYACSDNLITDNSMLHMSGIEFLVLLNSYGCKIPNRALVTASEKSEIIKSAENLDFDFFSKPFRIADLTKWLRDNEKKTPKERVLSPIKDLYEIN